MPRHSLNNTARGFYTSAEKTKFRNKKSDGIGIGMQHGTIKMRLGKDSQLPFGFCSLTLKPPVDPVATPSGHIYSKEALVKYLLEKIRELKRAKKAYNKQRANSKDTNVRKRAKAENYEKDLFLSTSQNVTLVPTEVTFEIKENVINDRKRKAVLKYHTKKGDDRSVEERRKELKRTSFWLPSMKDEATATKLKKPRKRPPSPISGKDLTLKDLSPITFGGVREDVTGPGRYLCCVTRKQITTQKVILLKNTQQVMLKDSYEKIVKPNMVCPITGETFCEDDVLELASGSSSFAASGKVESESWRPTL